VLAQVRGGDPVAGLRQSDSGGIDILVNDAAKGGALVSILSNWATLAWSKEEHRDSHD
jgi:hypothetical protein